MPTGDGEAAALAVRVIPAWRQYASLASVIIISILGLFLIVVAALRHRLRTALLAGCVAALLYGAS